MYSDRTDIETQLEPLVPPPESSWRDDAATVPNLDTIESDVRIQESEPQQAGGLQDRLWSTKLVSWTSNGGEEESSNRDQEEEDQPAPSISFKNLPTIEPRPSWLKEGDEGRLRQNALFVTSGLFGNFDTNTILSILSEVLPPPHPLGIEWVDDSNIVVVFSSPADAAIAFSHLADKPLDPLAPLEFHLITSITEELLLNYVQEAKPFFVRLARASDVKVKDAAKKSTYYSNQRETQRANRISERSSPYSRNDSGRGLEKGKGGLDDELDEYARLRDGGAPSVNSNSERRNGRENGRRKGRGEREEVSKASLDAELDAFLRGD